MTLNSKISQTISLLDLDEGQRNYKDYKHGWTGCHCHNYANIPVRSHDEETVDVNVEGQDGSFDPRLLSMRSAM